MTTRRQRLIGTLTARPVALLAVAVAGIAGTLVFSLLWSAEVREDRRADAARAAAEQFVVALTNFDGESIDADFDVIASYAHADFVQQLDEFFDTEIRQALREVEAASRGELRDLFLQDLDGDQARFFAVVDQTILNNKLAAPQADELRVELSLRRVDGAWRVSDLRVLQAPMATVAAEVGAG